MSGFEACADQYMSGYEACADQYMSGFEAYCEIRIMCTRFDGICEIVVINIYVKI